MAEHIRKNQYIGIGLEATPGTEVDPDIFFPFTGDLGAQCAKAWLTRNDEAFGIVDAYPPDGGRITIDDIPLNFKLNPEVGMYPLLAIIGQVSSAQQGSSVAYKHTFTTSAQDALPDSFTWEVYDTVDYYRLSEMRLKTLSLSMTSDGHVMVSTTWTGRIIRKIDSGDATAPSYSTIRLYKFDDIAIYIGDRQTFANQVLYNRIETMDLNLDRSVIGITTLNQQAYTTQFACENGRSSEGNTFVQRYQDATMRDLFWSNSTQPDSGAEYKSLDLRFVGDQIAATGFYYTTQLLFPLIHITDQKSSGESLIETITFNAYYDPLAAYFMTGSIYNTMTSI